MEVFNGYEFDAEELKNACDTVGLNNKVEDLDSLCTEETVNVTYIDLRALSDSNLVHMYHNKDNWDVDRVATYLEKHPFLYAEISLIKETRVNFPPYKMVVRSIKTLIDFYVKDRHAGIFDLMHNPIDNQVYCVEAEIHSLSENEGSCIFNEFCKEPS